MKLHERYSSGCDLSSSPPSPKFMLKYSIQHSSNYSATSYRHSLEKTTDAKPVMPESQSVEPINAKGFCSQISHHNPIPMSCEKSDEEAQLEQSWVKQKKNKQID